MVVNLEKITVVLGNVWFNGSFVTESVVSTWKCVCGCRRSGFGHREVDGNKQGRWTEEFITLEVER